MSNALQPKPRIIGHKVRICIVASKYNETFTDALVENVIEELGEIIQMARIDRSKLEEAVRLTFIRRGTHDLPVELLQPPDTWQTPYRRLAEECGLTWSMAESVQAVAELLRSAR